MTKHFCYLYHGFYYYEIYKTSPDITVCVDGSYTGLQNNIMALERILEHHELPLFTYKYAFTPNFNHYSWCLKAVYGHCRCQV